MNSKQFFDLTARVREAQKKYFSTPAEAYFAKKEALSQSKRLEKQLDAEIKRVKEIMEEETNKRISPQFPEFE